MQVYSDQAGVFNKGNYVFFAVPGVQSAPVAVFQGAFERPGDEGDVVEVLPRAGRAEGPLICYGFTARL